MLGSFNSCNILRFANKTTCSEDFNEVHKVLFDGMSTNMALLVQTGKYGAINAADPTTLAYYVVKYALDTFKL